MRSSPTGDHRGLSYFRNILQAISATMSLITFMAAYRVLMRPSGSDVVKALQAEVVGGNELGKILISDESCANKPNCYESITNNKIVHIDSMRTFAVTSGVRVNSRKRTAIKNNTRGAIQIVETCTEPGTVAITFDDGPYLWSRQIVEQFNAVGGRVTLFMNGRNLLLENSSIPAPVLSKSKARPKRSAHLTNCIFEYASDLLFALRSGHQIGSHTYYHRDITTLSAAELAADMNQLSGAFKRIFGAVPTYMRCVINPEQLKKAFVI